MKLLNEGSLFAEHYQLKKKLGIGSFGEVWLARNLLADLDVAVKIYSLVDDNGFNDFREEFKIAYKLNHPNLLHINHFDVYAKCPFLVMPYCKNGSVISQVGKLSEKQVWLFIRDVSCGLMYLHSQNPLIIHQDIKPGNILIADNGRYMISDFGISRKIRHTLHKNMAGEMSSGTLAYMGPEHFSVSPHIVATSDIWSLGMSVVELITGDVLWGGMGGSVQHNGASIPSLSDKCSPELEKLIYKCLSVQTWDRPSAKYVYEYSCKILQERDRSFIIAPSAKTPIYKNRFKSIPHSYSNVSILNSKILTFIKNYRVSTFSVVAALLVFYFLILELWGYVKKVEEQNALFKCVTLTDYYKFLDDYPSSCFEKQVFEKINELKLDSINNQNKLYSVEKYEDIQDTVVSVSVSSKEIEPQTEWGPISPKEKDDIKEVSELSFQERYLQNEKRFFNNCRTITDFWRYIEKYPKGRFVHDAKKAIREMESCQMDQKPEVQIRYEGERYILR